MNKYIRWQGFVTFVAITGFLALIVLVFLDTWIRIAIEQGGGRMVGAEINIDRVEHSFAPFGLTLYEVQVTDAEKPTHNVVQLARASADIAFLPLLRDKILVDELVVSGLRFDQPRESEGRVYQSVRETVSQRATEAGMRMPTVDEVLERSPLRITRIAEEAQATVDAQQASLAARYASLPDQDTLDEYEARFEALRERELDNPAQILAAREEFEAIMDDLRAERDTLSAFKDAVTDARGELGTQLTALRNAPGQDFDLLKGLVAGDAGAYSQVTEAVFGPQARIWSERLFAAYDLVAPMLANKKEEIEEVARAEGRWVEFTDTGATPDLLIRHAEVSVDWQGQRFVSLWDDITTDHVSLGRPTLFSVDSSNTPAWELLKIDGDFRFDPAGLLANQDWEIAGVNLSDLALTDSGRLVASLQSAILNSSGSLSIREGLLDGSGLIDFNALQIAAEGSNNITNVIAGALQSLSTLDITADIAGALQDPEFSFSSSLDQQLRTALLENISPEDQARLDELRSKLNALGSDALQDPQAGMAQWTSWESAVDNRLASVRDMLDTRIDEVIQEQTGGLRDRLRDSLFGGDD